ncbi:hypothetical protein TNCV_3329811 [Trichonephila clavipes]|nr:hypothetical protein TNCV_3329811 [Trichonephila clavipes]
MVLKANDRRTSCPCHDEFRGPRSDYVRQFLTFAIVLMAALVTSEELKGEGFHGHFDEHGYKVSIEHQPHGHEHHHHGGHGHSERYFHIHHHGHHGHQ